MKKYTIAFMVFAMVALSTVFAVAQKSGVDGLEGKGRGFGNRRHHHRAGGLGWMAAKLNLTDAQKAQIESVKDASKAKIQPLREAAKANHQKMKAATENGQFDEAAVTQIAQEKAAIDVQMTVEKERVKAQMFQILTAEQKTQLAQMKEQRKEGFQNRRGNREKKAEQNAADDVQ